MIGIDSLSPTVQGNLTDDDLLRSYEPPSGPWLRMNFVSSLDGAATRDGRAGALGDEADRRVFGLLRRWADVVLVGAGTVRLEGYAAMRLDDEASAWRVEHGLTAQPLFALVSGRLDLDPASPVFADAPVTPVVFTTADAPAGRRMALGRVATVVDAGSTLVDPAAVRAHLLRHGYRRIHCEGGPTLFGSLIRAGVVDELCLTLAPSLESGGAPRIAHGLPAAFSPMNLAMILRSGSELLLRYTR